jgi:single-strand DNA-binding protein
MAGFQKVIVCGNVGRDPEMRSLNSGDRLATISIATSETWRDKHSGERKEKTEWHRITIWGSAAEIVEKYVRKGDQLMIEGKLETRKWIDQSGQDRYSTEIQVKPYGGSVTLLGSGRGASNGNGRASRLEDREPDEAEYDQRPLQQRRNANSDLDDEIPFITCDIFADMAFLKHRNIV